MAESVIKVVTQSISIDNVQDILTPPAAQDPVTGEWVRLIQFYGLGPKGESMVVLELRLRASTRDPLNITSPAQGF